MLYLSTYESMDDADGNGDDGITTRAYAAVGHTPQASIIYGGFAGKHYLLTIVIPDGRMKDDGSDVD